MKGEPVIMKKLGEEERLGLLIGQSQDTYEELTISRGRCLKICQIKIFLL